MSISSVQFSRSVVSNSLQPHESQHARPPCPSTTPGLYSNSCQSSRWCHPAISSSVVPFSSCPQSLPASGSFPMSQLFTWSGQSIRVSALPSGLSVNKHPGLISFRMDWLDFLAVQVGYTFKWVNFFLILFLLQVLKCLPFSTIYPLSINLPLGAYLHKRLLWNNFVMLGIFFPMLWKLDLTNALWIRFSLIKKKILKRN